MSPNDRTTRRYSDKHQDQCGSGTTNCEGRFIWNGTRYVCDKCGDTCLRLQIK
jgi:hypothetical protein